jgi:hypothetical protein
MSATTHYECPIDHPRRPGLAGPGNHSPGCPVATGHTEGLAASPKCRACMHEYQLKSYRKRGRESHRNHDHPHYACDLPKEVHPIMRGVGQDHRAGCAVADGHTPGISAGSKGGCPGCKRVINKKAGRKIILKRHDLTLREYAVLFEQQGGRCAICRRSQEISLAVDHNHQTDQRRGLLCRGCNLGLGYFRDSPASLRAAADYLQFGLPDNLSLSGLDSKLV